MSVATETKSIDIDNCAAVGHLSDDERKRLNLELARLIVRRDELQSKRMTGTASEMEKDFLEPVEWRIGYLTAVRDDGAERLFPDDFAEGSEDRRYWFEGTAQTH